MHLQISRYAHIQTDLQRSGGLGGGGAADRQIDIIALSHCQSGGAIVNVSSPLLFQLEEQHTLAVQIKREKAIIPHSHQMMSLVCWWWWWLLRFRDFLTQFCCRSWFERVATAKPTNSSTIAAAFVVVCVRWLKGVKNELARLVF